jgi:hypothetical protein
MSDNPEALTADIKAAVSELADGRKYPDLLEAIDRLAALAQQAAPPLTPSQALDALIADSQELEQAAPPAAQAEPMALEPYDAGLLSDFGGGNVEWWQDYIRAELGRAHEFYQSQVAAPTPAAQAEPPTGWKLVPEEPTPEMLEAMTSSAWLLGCYRAMLAAAPAPAAQAEPTMAKAPECVQKCQQAADYGVWPQHQCSPTCVYLKRQAAAQAGDALPPPVGWRDELQRIRDHICAGGLAENMQHERAVVEPYLDDVEDSLAELERADLAARGQAGDALPPLPEPDSHCTYKDDHEYDVFTADQMRAYALAALAVRGAQAGDAWISVEDRLPEKETDVLAWAGRGGIVVAGMFYGDWLAVWRPGRPLDVTHWQPLPAAPTKGQPEGGAA